MGFDNDYKPKLRNVEPVPLSIGGRHAIGLKDPLQLADEMVCIPREAAPVVAMMDGNHSVRDIQAELTRLTGRIVYADDIRAVAEKLDESCLLDSDRFRDAFRSKVLEYRLKPFRPSSHAGASYSDDPETLRRELDHLFTEEGGPGAPDYFSEDRRPVGLVAPHIDIRSGGKCFAHAYHALASGQPADVYVVFGTGHAGVEGLFTATGLDFRTPLGMVKTDRDFLAELERELGYDPCAEEILHAGEHVIEFQAVFLQYLFQERRPFTIVPILCSLSHHYFADRSRFPEQHDRFEGFCRAIREVCGKAGRSVCFIASADLDHIGPRYGDSFVPHDGTVTDALEKDRELISHLERLDLAGFIRSVAQDNDSRRICGFSPITTMLRCMDAAEGKLLSLDYGTVDNQNSFVSFTSMVFY